MVAKTKRGEKWLRWGWVALYAADPSPLPPALSGFPTVMLFPRAIARLRSGFEAGFGATRAEAWLGSVEREGES